MPVNHIGIHQIGEQQSFKIILEELNGLFNAVVVIGGMVGTGHAAMLEDILDFSDSHNLHALRLCEVENGRACRLQREIPSVFGAGEAILCIADEGTRNDTPNAILPRQDFSCLFAHFIQLLDRNDILMRRNLEHAVRRGIDDGVACFHVLHT